MKFVILHVFSDSKFFNSVSDFFDSIKGVENLYYFFNEAGKCHIDSPKIKVISNKKEYIGYLSSKDINAIYFHSLPPARYWMFKYINPEKIVFWWSFGFDIYSSYNALPPLVKRELFKPKTLAYINNKKNLRNYLRQIHFLFRQPYDWYRRRRAISRIDYLTPVLPIEYDFLARECRYFRAKPFMKNCGPGLPSSAEFVFKRKLGNILIGNSRTYSNNHLDIFSSLNEIQLCEQRKYIIPANYGVDFSSCQELIDACCINSNEILWLQEFMPPSEFFNLFDSVSHAIYGHIRQQAMGNIFYCLRSGIKVFLYRDSIIYKQLKSLGYCVYTIDDDLNEKSLNSLLPENEALSNYNCFMKRNDFLNEEYILREIESVINEFEIEKKSKDMINVGIIGCGFVGGALKDWLEHNNPECKLFISDPPKGYNDDLSKIDIAFLQIHVPTEDDGTQDLTLMKELITKLPDVPVFVRTTILPGTSDRLTKETGHKVHYMPEFLTERTHIEDFKKQTMVFTGAHDLLSKIFVGKKFTIMSPLEAELTKYMHNVFGAYKVTYFNACREYCEQMGADWRKVHTGVLLSGYINDTHTYVPGPDGRFGYGGKCFPKDVNAFAKMTEGTPLGTLLEHLHELNVHFRGVEERI